MIKAVIFDLDGTICDTLDDICDALNIMLLQKNFPTLTRTDVLEKINYGAFELVRRSLPNECQEDLEFIKDCLKIYSDAYSKCYDNKTYPFEGIIEVIQSLKARRLKLAVLSNKQDEFVKKIIDKIFPQGLFDLVLGDGPFPPKPKPESAHYVCRTLGALPEECAMVGDSHIDMQTGVNAGLLPVGVTWGYRSREVLIDNGAKIIVEKVQNLLEIAEN